MTLTVTFPPGLSSVRAAWRAVAWQAVGMTSAQGRLDGTAALVTGATSGLERAVAIRLAEGGADVALLGRHEGDLARVAQEVRSTGRRALPLPVDLAATAELGAVVDRVAAELGGLGVLVNAGGQTLPAPRRSCPSTNGSGCWR